MNYLAHVFLAKQGDEKSILGNFLGDFVNITTERVYDEDIRAGIHMHRRLDSYTDAHPIFQASRRRVSAKNRRFAGVLVDIFYDHFLAKHWGVYSDIPLKVYADEFYMILDRNFDILPDKLQGMLPFMITENWFVQYRETRGIESVLNRISKRFAHTRRPLVDPIDELIMNNKSLEKDFITFFPAIEDYARRLRVKQVFP
ncbi:MAG: DUF479 domain-containing protein [Clostridiales bacterium]|nr:DUF479 domain-containing protein [Clostridiales bacterium]